LQLSMGVIVGLPSSSRQQLGQQQQQQRRSDAAVSARVSTCAAAALWLLQRPQAGPTGGLGLGGMAVEGGDPCLDAAASGLLLPGGCCAAAPGASCAALGTRAERLGRGARRL
jgi:hypothetical protein